MELRYVIGMDTEHQAPPTTAAKPVYVVAAHPNWRESRVNRRLMQAAHAAGTATDAGIWQSVYTQL